MSSKANGASLNGRRTLAQLQKPTRALTVEYEDVAVTFHYRPAAFNARLERLLLEEPDEGETQRHNRMLVFQSLIANWDLETEEGEPLPVTLEHLEQIPSALLGDFLAKVSEDVSMGGKSSGGESSTP
jgi:hypothetical protein